MKKIIVLISTFAFLIILTGISNTSADSDFTSGLDLFNKAKYPQARDMFQRVITHFEIVRDKENQKYILALFYRASCNEQLGELQLALNDYLIVDKKNIPSHEVWMNIVSIYTYLKEEQKAIDFLKEKLKDGYRFDYLLELGKLYWKIEDTPNALATLESAKVLNGNDEDLLFYLSYLYWETDDLVKAGQSAVQLKKLVDDPIIDLYCDGIVFLSMGLYEKASNTFKSALHGEPKDLTINALLLDSYVNSADFTSADNQVKKLIEADRSNSWNWFKAAEIPLYKLDFNGAQVLYDSLDVKIKEQPSAVLLHTFILANKGKIAEAESTLQRQRDHEFMKPVYYPALATIKFITGKPNEISKIKSLYSENVKGEFPIESSLFWLIMYKGKYNVPGDLTRLSELLGSTKPKIRASNAMIDFLIHAGDLKTARIHNDELAKEEPSNPAFPFRSTVLSIRLGEMSNAKAYWKKYKALINRDKSWKYMEDEMDKLLK
jgi:tetratricopeptide (TPR) repeat protein